MVKAKTQKKQSPLKLDLEQARWIHDMLYDYEFTIETARAKGNAHITFLKWLLENAQYPEWVTEEMVKDDLQTIYDGLDAVSKAEARRLELIKLFQEYLWITPDEHVEDNVVEWELIEEHDESIQPVHEVSETDTPVSQEQQEQSNTDTDTVLSTDS